MDPFVAVEISVEAVRSNLRLFRKQIGPNVRLAATVKSDCYGHGLDLLAEAIGEECDWLCVAGPSEAMRLRALGCRKPILAFFSACAYAEPGRSEALEALIAADVVQTVVDPGEVPLIAAAARALGRTARVHLQVDTGMNRSGVQAERAAECVARIRSEDGIRLGGIFTHFAVADEADKSFTFQQLEQFLQRIDECGLGPDVLRHAANSAALIDLPGTHLDLVRPGISVYGYQPSEVMRTRLDLRPALRVSCPLLQVRSVPAGQACGYGLTYEFSRPTRIGRVPIGYGDGYLRCLSNRAVVGVRGCEAPVRGRVSMDQLIIDVTDVPGAAAGDEVEVISADPAAPHSVENLARLANTIPYEITCRLGGPRVRRFRKK